MKLHFQFGINGGGMLAADLDSISEARDFLDFAIQIGVVNTTPAATPAPEQPAEAPAPEKAAKAPKATKAKKEEAAKEQPGESAPTAEEPASEASPPESESATTAEKSTTVSVDEAAQAVKDYAARTSIEKGRALLGKFGFKRTSDITPEKAAEVLAATKE